MWVLALPFLSIYSQCLTFVLCVCLCDDQSAEDVIAEQAKQQDDDPFANLSKKEKKKKKKQVTSQGCRSFVFRSHIMQTGCHWSDKSINPFASVSCQGQQSTVSFVSVISWSTSVRWRVFVLRTPWREISPFPKLRCHPDRPCWRMPPTSRSCF